MNTAEKNKYLDSVLNSYDLELPHSEKEYFQSLFQYKELKKGEHLIMAGDKKPVMAYIVSGLVRFYFNTFQGKEFNQTFLKEEQIIVEYYCAFTGEAAPFNIQALENTKLLVCDYNHIEKLYEQHRNWERIGRKLVEQNFIVKFKRETTLLLMDTKERYLYFLENFQELLPRLSQQDIALYLGVNPSTLNRLIKGLGKS